MSYSDFTLESLRHKFAITVRDQMLFDAIGDLLPSPWLRQSLERGLSTYTVTEKARSEFIVAPILAETCVASQYRFNVFSGITLDAEPQNGLNGECDFIFARSVSKYDLQAPLMLILEAKKHDIDLGLGQCAAQMIAACRYNERDGKHLPYIYGCVTNGYFWHFLRLQGTDLQLHPERLEIKEISKSLWFLTQCLKDVDQQASDAA